MNKQKDWNKLDIQGHRGCRGLMPENTIEAMYKAIDLDVTTLEMDLCITGDNIVIVSHEPFFNHEITTKPNKEEVKESEEKQLNIFKLKYDEVKMYDVGLKVHPRFLQQQKQAAYKPTLKELLEKVKLYCINKKKVLPNFNIEIKSLPPYDNIYHPIPEVFVELVARVLEESQIDSKKFTIQSFDYRPLQVLKRKNTPYKIALLIEEEDKSTTEEQFKKLGFLPDIYSPNYKLVSKELITYLKQKNIKCIPWTINNFDDIKKLIAIGVDGIITDYPNLFKENKNDQ